MPNSPPNSESENVKTDNKPFEWGALPIDLRFECLGKMDFKTSMQLRATSRFNKLIVESPRNKPKFDRMRISHYKDDIYVYLLDGEDEIEMHDEISGVNYNRKVESLITCLLKYSTINRLQLHGSEDKDSTKMFDKMAAVAPTFPILNLSCLNEGNFQLALENFGSGVEIFSFWRPPRRCLERALRDPLLIPKLLNAKHIQITKCPVEPFVTLIGLWIQFDKDMGSKLISNVGWYSEWYPGEYEYDGFYKPDETEKPMFASFRETFAERVVYDNEKKKTIRITTDNPEKHIVMRIILNINQYENSPGREVDVHMVCQVIPATMKEKHYEKTAGWIELI